MTVEYEGKFYEIGSTHKEYQMDKVWDEDYYILTFAALAKELKGRGLCTGVRGGGSGFTHLSGI